MKNGQKRANKRTSGLFKKIMPLVLSENCVKLKNICSFNILRKLHAREKSDS